MISTQKYRSHSASTVLIQQVPFSGLYFDEQVPSLQIRITVLFSADLQTPRTALPGFPAILPVFQNVSTHFYYPYAHSVIALFTRCRHNRRKLITYRATLPPSWENGTWQVPSQLSHSDKWETLNGFACGSGGRVLGFVYIGYYIDVLFHWCICNSLKFFLVVAIVSEVK